MHGAIAPNSMKLEWTDGDIEEFKRRGIPIDRANDQIARLSAWQPWIDVDRPATAGDGILNLGDFDPQELMQATRRAAEMGRLGAFIPASGDATRMFERLSRARQKNFADLDAVREAVGHGDEDAKEGLTIASALQDMAIGDALLERGIDNQASWPALIEALAGQDADSFSKLPKGLIPFHKMGDRSSADAHYRTAVGEHIMDASSMGATKVLFTVQQQHTSKFDAEFDRMRQSLKAFDLAVPDIAHTLQDSRFDALAMSEGGELDGNAVRVDGRLLFRPGGHGVLIHALDAMQGDIVLIRNIDNVVHETFKAPGYDTRRLMTGLAIHLQEKIHKVLSLLRDGHRADQALSPLDGLLDWNWRDLGVGTAELSSVCKRLLDRPLRVCGMVRDLAHKGGGPFWVNKNGSISLQIVEGANLNGDDASQAKAIGQSTHFNPVDIVAAVRRPDGSNYKLADYRDEDAVILTRKTRDGQPIKVFEYPGLWNGGMGNWNTVFVDIPAALFNPVKYLSDLLAERHRL